MAKLTAGARQALPKSKFAGPGRSYPVNDRAHASDAKARATQMENADKLAPSTAASIKAKANKVLGADHPHASSLDPTQANRLNSGMSRS